MGEVILGPPGHGEFDTIPKVYVTEPKLARASETEKRLETEDNPYEAGTAVRCPLPCGDHDRAHWRREVHAPQ